MQFGAIPLLVVALASHIILAKNTFVYKCLSYIRDPYDKDIVTFLCDNQYHAIKYFEKPNKYCSNNTAAFAGWSIRTIHFHDCQMSRIPYNIFPIYYNLRVLNISSMCLDELQQTLFAGANALERVNASHNRLKAIRTDQFALASGLSTVDVSFNNITTIEIGAFDERSGQLQWLDMSHNQIHHIPLETFHKLLNLTHLYLEHNRLESIDIGTFALQKNLIILDVSFNWFKVLDLRSILPHVGSLEVFSINGNPLRAVSGYMHQLFPRLMWSEYFSISVGDVSTEKVTENIIDTVRSSVEAVDAENVSVNDGYVESTTSNRSVNDNDNGKSLVGDFVSEQQPHNGTRSIIFEIVSVITMVVVVAMIIRQLKMESINRIELNAANCRYHVADNSCSALHENGCDAALIA